VVVERGAAGSHSARLLSRVVEYRRIIDATKHSSKPMFEPQGPPHYLHLTIEQARAMRAEQARLAAVCANRYTQARDAARHGATLRWAAEYRRCAARCRRLGERIRGELSDSADAVAERDPTVVLLARQRIPDVAPTGEAR
jgi:hypothetical protein